MPRWSRCWTTAAATPPARSGWPSTCCPGAPPWRWPAPTARPPPPACWPSCCRPPGATRASWSAASPRTSAPRRGWAAAASSWSRPTSTTPPSSTSAASSCTTGRRWRSSTTSSTTTPTSSRTWPRSSASSTTWCAPCRAPAGSSSTAKTRTWPRCWRWAAGPRWRPSAWSARLLAADGSQFVVLHDGREVASVHWPLLGRHNVLNALAALAAAHAVGVSPADVAPALAGFHSVKRRLEVLGTPAGVTVYDDFAHHPTAIRTTLEGLRARVGDARIVVAMEPRSNSMRLGAHADALAPSLDIADVVVFLHRPELAWDAGRVIAAVRGQAQAVPDTDALLACLRETVRPGDHVVFMSNGGFDAAPRRFVAMLEQG